MTEVSTCRVFTFLFPLMTMVAFLARFFFSEAVQQLPFSPKLPFHEFSLSSFPMMSHFSLMTFPFPFLRFVFQNLSRVTVHYSILWLCMRAHGREAACLFLRRSLTGLLLKIVESILLCQFYRSVNTLSQMLYRMTDVTGFIIGKSWI